jgi:hypothetical protein
MLCWNSHCKDTNFALFQGLTSYLAGLTCRLVWPLCSAAESWSALKALLVGGPTSQENVFISNEVIFLLK